MNDLHFALRQLSKHPVQALMLAGILSLGIAGTTAVFSLFNTVFLQPLPVPDQDRLVSLSQFDPVTRQESTVPYPPYCAWRRDNRTFASMSFSSQWVANITHNGATEHLGMRYVTAEFFDLFGVRPLLGRTFIAEKNRPGGPNVVLLGEGVWKRLFHGDLNIMGKPVCLDGDPTWTIVGVVPDDAFPDRRGLWCPLRVDPEKDDGGLGPMAGGRLKPGVTLAQAEADLTRLQQGWAAQHPEKHLSAQPKITPMREAYLRLANEYRFVLFVTLGVVGLVLIIACCNAASAMLAQGAQQSHDFAIRAALGATRQRMIRLVLAQSLILGLAGSVVGVLLGSHALRGLVSLLGDLIPTWMRFSLDFRSVLFCLLMLVVATLLSGLLPAWQAAAPSDLRSTLQTQGTRGVGSPTRRRILEAISVAQVVVAMTLLGGAGLILRTYFNVLDTDPGFRTQGVLTCAVQLSIWPYLDENKRRNFWQEYLEKVQALPGIEHAALINSPPMSFPGAARFDIADRPPPRGGGSPPYVLTWKVTPDYFAAVGIPLLAGRGFVESDNRRHAERTAIIDQTFARTFWPNANPIGKRVRPEGAREWIRIVGLVRDSKQITLEDSPQPSLYQPSDTDPGYGKTTVVQTTVDSQSLVAALRAVVRSIDPGVAIENVSTLAQRVHDSMGGRRLLLWMYGIPAVVAAILALVGLYGVTAYAVSQRTQEIGIRMALGARVPEITGMVMGQGLRLVGVGLAVGCLGAIGLGRVLASMDFMLYHVGFADPWSFAGVGLLLAAGATLACYLPARKAANVDPREALRNE